MHKSSLFINSSQPTDVSDYYHVYNKSNALNSFYWSTFLRMIEDVSGDIVECGVGRGRSLISILSLLELFQLEGMHLDRKVFALDSFEGFPQPTNNDKSWRNPKVGDWAFSPNKEFKYSPESLLKVLNSADIDYKSIDKLQIIPGFFSESTTDLKTDSIALLHVDGDLYESTREPLINLAPKVTVGGIIVVDDHILDLVDSRGDDFPGSRQALSEFLALNSNFELHSSIRGNPYLIKLAQ